MKVIDFTTNTFSETELENILICENEKEEMFYITLDIDNKIQLFESQFYDELEVNDDIRQLVAEYFKTR